MSTSIEVSAPSEVRIETAAQQSNWPSTEVVIQSNADETNGIGISKSYLKSLSGILRILIIVNKNLMYLNKVRLLKCLSRFKKCVSSYIFDSLYHISIIEM